MADLVTKGRIDILTKAAQKRVRSLSRELETLGGKAAVKTQREIKKLERDIGKLGGSTAKATPLISRFTAGIAKGNLIAMAGQKAFSLLADSFEKLGEATLLAARVETLNRVVVFTGRNAGNTGAQIQGFRDDIIDLGITQRASLEIMQRFLQAELDLADATKIARLAQDAATIAGVNSSEAALQMTDAINALRPRLLKTFGIMVNLNDVYREASLRLGKNVDELTAFERKQALLNATLEQGKTIAGVYETAMETTGKQITSLPRLFENAGTALGQFFVPALGVGVVALSGFLKGVEAVANFFSGPDIEAMNVWADDFAADLRLLTPEIAANLDIIDEYHLAVEKLKAPIEEATTALGSFTNAYFKQEEPLEGATKALDGLDEELATYMESVGAATTSTDGFSVALVDMTGSGEVAAAQMAMVSEAIDRVKFSAQIIENIKIKPFKPLLDIPEGPTPDLLTELPDIMNPDVLKAAEDGFARVKKEMDVSAAEESYKRFQQEVKEAGREADALGKEGTRAARSIEDAMWRAAGAVNSLINDFKRGEFTFGGFLQAISFIPGLGVGVGPALNVFGNILPFDDPVNDSALVRETRRMGSFISKGLAQSAATREDREPNQVNIRIDASGMNPDELFRELERRVEQGFVTLGTA